MCRYAWNNYKPHFVCFNCRKTYKRRLFEDIYENGDKAEEKQARCPQCGGYMADIGTEFKAPKKGDLKAWKQIEKLYQVDFTFHSCGCSGPGYVPKNEAELKELLLLRLGLFKENLKAWRKAEQDPSATDGVSHDKAQISKAINCWQNTIDKVQKQLQTLG